MGDGLKRVAKICGGLTATSDGMTIAHPPPADPGLENEVVTVNVPPGHSVRWIFRHTPAGTCVTGYKLVKERKD